MRKISQGLAPRLVHKLCVTHFAGAAFAIFGGSGVALAQGSVEAAYVVIGPQGAVARVIVNGAAACPAIELDGMQQAMQMREPAEEGAQARFPVTVCDKLIPPSTAAASIAGRTLPLPGPRLTGIVAFGDTGCRVKALERGPQAGSTAREEEEGQFQDCNDPSQWPFGKVAAAAAATRPDLVIHVGDYLYRESPCPASDSGCRGSPWGDDWAAWKADFFEPAAPLLAAVPWIMTRGNHEDCKRAGLGYFRFLDPDPATAGLSACIEQIPPYTVTIGGRSFVILDNSDAPDFKSTSADIERYASQLAGLHPPSGSWLVTHRPIWGILTVRTDSTRKRQLLVLNETLEKAVAATGGSLPAGIELVVSGHIHLWQAIAFADKRPPQLVLGSGGTDLSPPVEGALSGLEIGGTQVAFGRSEHLWGFTRFAPGEAGAWNVTFFDPEGRAQVTCSVAQREIGCK
jgi:Calcineurin-like phosphoesterase